MRIERQHDEAGQAAENGRHAIDRGMAKGTPAYTHRESTIIALNERLPAGWPVQTREDCDGAACISTKSPCRPRFKIAADCVDLACKCAQEVSAISFEAS
jgi:hypothetical protein